MTRPGAGGTEGRCAAAPRTQGSWRGSARRAAARGRRPHTRPASSVCAPGRPRDRWGAWERVLSRGGTASRAPLASGSPGPSVASVCDGAVAAFWFEQAYAYRSHAVIHALDLVSVELKLAHDRGREVNPADAQLGKADRLLAGLPQSLKHSLLLAVSSVIEWIVAPKRVASGAEPACERHRHIAACRDPQQLTERRREPDHGDRHLDLNRAGVAVDDPHRAEAVEKPHHLLVTGQHQRGEGRDRLLARPRADHLEQQRTQAPSLPVIDHGHGELRRIAAPFVARVADHPDPFAGLLVQRDDRFVVVVVVVVDLEQVAHHRLTQLRHRRKKAPITRLGAQALKAALQQLLIGAVTLAHANARTVAQHDRRTKDHELIRGGSR